MPSVQRTALMPYSAEQMFDLVNDIEQYPRYLRSCKSARVISSTPEELVGELCLAKAGIRQCFTTRNKLNRPESIELELVEGEFSRFRGRWHFQPLSESACNFGIDIEFAFKSALVGFAAEKLLAGAMGELVDAMVRRAHEVYGNA